MFCTQCGQEINDKAVICVKCGCAVTPQAAQPIAPEVKSADELPEKWTWALATVPIIVSWILAGLLPTVFENSDPSRLAHITTAATILLNLIFLSLDVKVLKKAERDIEKALWLGFILIPVYLFVRAAKYSKKYAPAIVWCVLFVLDLVATTDELEEKQDSAEQNATYSLESRGVPVAQDTAKTGEIEDVAETVNEITENISQEVVPPSDVQEVVSLRDFAVREPYRSRRIGDLRKGAAYKYEAHPGYMESYKVLQVVSDGCILAIMDVGDDPDFSEYTQAVILVKTKREYVDDQYLESGVYAYRGTYTYETTLGGSKTVPQFQEVRVDSSRERKPASTSKINLKTIVAREDGNVVGMFGVRLGVKAKALSEKDVGAIGKPIVVPESQGGGLLYRYDYRGNRGIWDMFTFQTEGEDSPVFCVEAVKSYDNEAMALSGAQSLLVLLKNRYGVSMTKNQMATKVHAWFQILKQPHNTVLATVKVAGKEGTYLLSYSMMALPPDT